MQEEAPGMVFWHANGWTIYQVLEQYMRKVQQDNGYQEIKTPQIVDFTLWEKSGHATNYAENMFTTHSESRNYAVKPMNCPCHVQVFNQGLKSYRDLPIRLAEFGSVTVMSRLVLYTVLCVFVVLLKMMRISSVLKNRSVKKLQTLLNSL